MKRAACGIGPAIVLMIGAAAGLAAATDATAAGSVNNSPRLALHLTTPTAKSPCLSPSALPACTQIVTNGNLGTYYALVILTNGSPTDGVGSVTFGVSYDGAPGSGVDVFGWSPCAASQLATGTWPAPDTGIRLDFNPCRTNEPLGTGTGVAAVACYFYLSAYSPDELRLADHPDLDYWTWTNCAGGPPTGFGSSFPSLGEARFTASGTATGWNPCVPYPEVYEACTIAGPRNVGSNSLVHLSIVNPKPGVEYHWFPGHRDDFTIVSLTVGTSIVVRTATFGNDEILVSTMGQTPIINGVHHLVVNPAIAVTPTTWSSIKLFPEVE